MKVTVEDQSSVKKVMHIQIPRQDVVNELNNAYTELKKNAKIKGFRPGKAPRSLLERMYRKDVNADVTSKLMQNAFIKALQETKFKVVGTPQIDPPELDDQNDYAFDAVVEIHPEIADIDFKGLELTKTNYQVSDAEIGNQLDLLRKQMAKREKIKQDRPVQSDDWIVVDYEGFHKDGEPVKSVEKTENFIMKVGEGRIGEDFDNGVTGMSVDEEKKIPVTFPADYFNKDLAGQHVVFKVKLHEIREEILPELDDELAKNFGDRFDSLEALKNGIADNLKSGYDKRIEQELNEQIFQHLLEKTEFEVPDALINSELDYIIQDAERSFAHNNRTFEDAGLSKEKLAEQYRPTAEKQVRRHLILGKLIDQENLKLTDEELDQGFQKIADMNNQPKDQIKAYYDQNNKSLDFLKHTLLEKKVLKLIINHSHTQEVEPTDEETADAEKAPTSA